MIIFTGGGTKKAIAIPINRVYEITQTNNRIAISYDAGDVMWLDEEKTVKKVTTIEVIYNNYVDAEEAMQNFYDAVANGEKAFSFTSAITKRN